MKSFVAKLSLLGLLAAVLFGFCPQAAPVVYQPFAPPAAWQPEPVLPPPGIKYLAGVEDLVFDLTNQARRARGLAPLIKDNELRQVARAFSNDMLVRHFFNHTTPDGVTFEERINDFYHHRVWALGENIWYASGGISPNPQRLAQEIVAVWMNSPGHRANLLDPDFTHLGVGISARGQDVRATQEFVGRSKGFRFGRYLPRHERQ